MCTFVLVCNHGAGRLHYARAAPSDEDLGGTNLPHYEIETSDDDIVDFP